eukprot:scaffold114417_cov63-Phaeocystis_antarctica.AAC.1
MRPRPCTADGPTSTASPEKPPVDPAASAQFEASSVASCCLSASTAIDGTGVGGGVNKPPRPSSILEGSSWAHTRPARGGTCSARPAVSITSITGRRVTLSRRPNLGRRRGSSRINSGVLAITVSDRSCARCSAHCCARSPSSTRARLVALYLPRDCASKRCAVTVPPHRRRTGARTRNSTRLVIH